MVAPVIQQARRRTLIKPCVGMVRAVPYSLPDGPFGNQIERDEATASNSIHGWPCIQHSRHPQHSRSFVETNRRAVSKEARTSSDFRQYLKNHMIVRKKNPLIEILNSEVSEDGTAGRRCSIPLGTAPYRHKSRRGIYSGIEKHDTTVFGERTSSPDSSSAKLCVTGAFTSWENNEANYPLIRRRKAKKKQAKETKASRGHAIHHSADGAPDITHVEFKMKRFLNVKGRVSQPLSVLSTSASCPSLPSVRDRTRSGPPLVPVRSSTPLQWRHPGPPPTARSWTVRSR